MTRRKGKNSPTAHEANSVSHFLEIIEERFPQSDDLLFRGQRQDWPLLPRIARIRLRPETELLETEQSLLDELQLQAPSLVDMLPQNEWEWLSLAQHYGMATRLLDWTTNPLAALWFATQKPAENGESAVVWIFDPEDDDRVKQLKGSPFAGERTQVLQPKHIARRIIAQSGWFTVHKYIGKEKAFVALEHQSRYVSALSKIIVPPTSFSKIRYGLAQCGINPASMLTDLSGVCAHIEWRHSLMLDEVEETKAQHAMQRTCAPRRKRTK
jgi:hypothetical protein